MGREGERDRECDLVERTREIGMKDRERERERERSEIGRKKKR